MKRPPFFAPGAVEHYRKPLSRVSKLRRFLLAACLAGVLLLVTNTPVLGVYLALGMQALGRML